MRNVLVTGDLGFVGRHMVKALEARGDHVTGIDIKRGPGWDVRRFFRDDSTRFDLVIHLAAVVGGRQTIEGSPLAVAVDLSIDAELFGWALRTRQPRIVYYSSSAAYPIALQTRQGYRLVESDINVNDIRSPDLTYGWAKLTGEYQAQFLEAEGVRVHVFRPFSGYGTDQDLDYPFPSFIDRGRRRADPFQVWGDGHQVRDFIHIDDVVGATLAAVDKDVRGPVNLGMGRPTAFNTLAAMVCERAGYLPTVEHLPGNPVGVHYRVADASRMLAFYTPTVTLEEGIARAVAGDP